MLYEKLIRHYFSFFFFLFASPLSASFIIMSLFFFKFKISCHSCFEILHLNFKFSSEKLCFCKNLITDSKTLFRLSGRQKLDLFLTREELGVSDSVFSEKKLYESKFSSKIFNVFFPFLVSYVVELV